MLGRIVSMIAGRSLARSVGGAAAGPDGAVIGVLLPTVLRRLGPGGMIAALIATRVYRQAAKRAASR